MPNNWDVNSNLWLLFHVVDQTGAKPSWDVISAAMGTGYTAEACRQHFAKLKKTMSEDSTNAGAIDSAAVSPATPSPRKRKPKEPKTPGETPTKRPRKITKKVKAEEGVKKEDTSGDVPTTV
ncbi:hypothetical protein LOZ53_001043 [Ophidiomyces ophidiicola]|uniref:Uncharacterized protein n=1 Tax=Ophidiomyces ophidiicola TaxID=1387563 RepID=A0ACB8UVB7_9EURO|nr:uncharacterized protein LOZ57_000959 [Ophidiomyces ophidiicola]KAI1945948.1 hypothetical protein LOZ62_003551 [Ophidiomyces ophidiicola]KAI1952876.1 hypothetical protein LOZ57_000959 [Ophidiomyces ophidiicola]KAI1955996.1 hypothetical protein LOZ59_004378 [Ophidiomyces ophidiicola]KAI1971463.1 hypothetical protein LOZ56_003032 [Ophidiomyces ophidiicola]KAI1976622.1 hypothetical protein LOZ55_004172 [Ophidiomyces ophidiicola]